MSITDEQYMQRAIQLAQLGGVHVAPNPKVGAVIVHNHQIIGEGYHQKYGFPHAEVNAIESVKDKTLLTASTMYVTLEPCSHTGKTPPCSDLIIQHQIKRVVIATQDSNKKVAGSGIQHLKNAGIEVEVGVLEREVRWQNRRFFTFQEEKRPYVILKWAETRDGFMDRLPEERKEGVNWITQPEMKLHVHKWRSEEPAIMVGWRTINNDNPQLTVRKFDRPSPHRFIIDPNGKANPNSTVFTDGNPTSIFTLKKHIPNLPEHVHIISLPTLQSKTILSTLYQQNISSVFIEGGAQTLAHFINDDLWDEAYQLIGSNTFNKGIHAPRLTNSIFIASKKMGADYIQTYHHKK